MKNYPILFEPKVCSLTLNEISEWLELLISTHTDSKDLNSENQETNDELNGKRDYPCLE